MPTSIEILVEYFPELVENKVTTNYCAFCIPPLNKSSYPNHLQVNTYLLETGERTKCDF